MDCDNEKYNIFPSDETDTELGMTIVRDCVSLSLSRRNAMRFAIAVGFPIFGKVDKSPDAAIPSSSSKTLVGNLYTTYNNIK